VATMRNERVLSVTIMYTSVRNMVCSPSRPKCPLDGLWEWKQRTKEYDDMSQTQNRSLKNVWTHKWTDHVSIQENYQCNHCWRYKKTFFSKQKTQ